MNTNRRSKNVGLTCCSVIFFLSACLMLFLDFLAIDSLDNVHNKMTSLNSPNVNCYYACGSYYQPQNQLCCLYSYSYCKTIETCIKDQLSKLQYDQGDFTIRIWIYSILTIVMIIVFIVLRRCICLRNIEGNNPRNRNPLLDNLNGNINHSQSSKKKQKKIDAAYQSFAYQDNQSTCCVCLEEFNNEKSILLKCGHIFHSKCIRDWATKQQNCPVCRSSQ